MTTPAPTPAATAPARERHGPSRRTLPAPASAPDFALQDPSTIPTRAESIAREVEAAARAIDAAPEWDIVPMGNATSFEDARRPAGRGALRAESMGATVAAPYREWLTSRVQIAEAVRATIALAQLTIACADADGASFDLSSRATVELLERLLLSQPRARVRVLVDDPQWLDRGAARLRLLQRRYPHALMLRVTDPDDTVGDERVLIADHAHFVLLRPQAERLGERWTQHAPRAAPLMAAFNRRWERAAHDLPVQPLGL